MPEYPQAIAMPEIFIHITQIIAMPDLFRFWLFFFIKYELIDFIYYECDKSKCSPKMIF